MGVGRAAVVQIPSEGSGIFQTVRTNPLYMNFFIKVWENYFFFLLILPCFTHNSTHGLCVCIFNSPQLAYSLRA